MSIYEKINTALACEDREGRLPQWAQAALQAGRAANKEADYWRDEVAKIGEELAETRRLMAEGITDPNSDTWISAPGGEQGIGLGKATPVLFGAEDDDWTFLVVFVDGGLDIRAAGPTVIRTNHLARYADLRIETA